MIRLMFLFLCFLPLPTLAQTLRVLSGEHANFTRLALVMPGVEDWSFGKTESGYDLRVSPSRTGFDTRGVFALIPRTRLSGLEADPSGGRLSLMLGCDCHAIATEVRRGVLAIDIFDGPGPLVRESEVVMLQGMAFEPLPDMAQSRPRARPGSRPPFQIPNFLREELWQSKSLPQNFIDSLGVTSDPEDFLADSPFGKALLKELSRATLTGVLDPSADFTSARSQADPTPLRPNTDQMRIRLPSGQIALGMPQTDACPEDASFDIASWADTRPFAIQLAELRNGLLQEFDMPDSDAVLRVARFYIAAGFGAEAMNTLSMLAAEGPEKQLLYDMAQVVDDLDRSASVLHRYRACDGRVALWSLMALPSPDRSQRLESAAIVRAYSELPPSLRRELGPRLVEILMKLDQRAAAEDVQNALHRAEPESGPELLIVQARIAAGTGQTTRAETLLHETSQVNGPLAPVALIELVNTLFDRGVPPDERTILLLESHALEGRSSRLGPELNNALSKALLLSGEVGRAFTIGNKGNGDLMNDLYRGLAAYGEAKDVLQFGTVPEPYIRDALSISVREAMAQRFITIGLPELAEGWVSPVARGLEVAPQQAAMTPPGAEQGEDGRRVMPLVLPLPVDENVASVTKTRTPSPAEGAQTMNAMNEAEAGLRTDLRNSDADPQTSLGPLARARRATEQAASVLSEIERLLEAEYASPQPGS